MLADLIFVLYLGVMTALGALGLHRLQLAWSASRPGPAPVPRVEGASPVVTVQVPLYNEREVAGRVLEAVGSLRWPRDRIEVQVLDDSTDDTRAEVDAGVVGLQSRGVVVALLRRSDRRGFKAGALEAGLASSRGEVIAVFDADFVPDPDFLERTVPRLVGDVGMVQARWGHLNASDDWLTAAQATLLDAHFVLEHGGRFHRGCWFNFNGTAGIWRREAIEGAGGWQHDTLTEDLDLSYRAQLAGWRFVYLDEVVAPAELPPTLTAFKAQQHRWARGGAQTARKLLGRVLRSGAPLHIRLEATAHLLGGVGYPLTLVLAVILPLMPWARARAHLGVPPWLDAALFLACVVPLVTAYGLAVVRSGHGVLWRRLVGLPRVLALGIGLSWAQSWAVWLGFTGPIGVFERTPKKGARPSLSYRVAGQGTGLGELLLAGWQGLGLGAAWWWDAPGSMPFLALFGVGYAMVGARSLRESLTPAVAPAVSVEIPREGIPGGPTRVGQLR